jgi:hypothetical protein
LFSFGDLTENPWPPYFSIKWTFFSFPHVFQYGSHIEMPSVWDIKNVFHAMHYLSYYRMCPYQPAITYLAMTESITKKLDLIKNQWWKQCPHQLHCVQRIYFWRVDISSHLHDYILLQWWWLSGEDISSLFSTFWTITTWLSVKKNSNQQRVPHKQIQI